MNKVTFPVCGWVSELTFYPEHVGTCGKSVGLTVNYESEDIGGGVMDFHEVARLHTFLGEWLWRVEQGEYQKAAKEYNERLQKFKLGTYPTETK